MALQNGQDEVTEKLSTTEFDAVQHLNEILPILSLSSQGAAAKNRSVQLQSATTEIQSEISKLNAFNARTSTELSMLTDEILRSSNRLAYEVEVLRSNTNGLFDLLSETLQQDIQYFVGETSSASVDNETNPNESEGSYGQNQGDPEFMQQLRLLGHVKLRLEEIIHVFGDALKWPIPPSDVSMASTLISVSAPELGVANSAEDDKARVIIRQYREEIVDLLNSEGGGYAGLEAAQKRLDEFQNLVTIWKGTAEEKARYRVVEGFAKLVDDRKKTLDSQTQQRRPRMEAIRSSAQSSRAGTPAPPTGGLLGGLRKLRDEIYLD